MNQGSLEKQIAEHFDIPAKQADAILNFMLESIGSALENGEKVTLIGLGTFQVVTREARTGRNPLTGEPIDVPEKQAVKFSASKPLKERVQRKTS